MTTDPLTGSCLCGAVRYAISGGFAFIGNCHCSICRKANGAAFATWGILAETLMLFVGNRRLVQIFIGSIRRVVRTEGWLNVLDPSFHLHLRDRAIAQAWIVDKPTRHGPVRSLEWRIRRITWPFHRLLRVQASGVRGGRRWRG